MEKQYQYFQEQKSEEAVIERMDGCQNERLKKIMESFIRHLHAMIKEIEPTQKEWEMAIQFLTDTGHMCDELRQEFILLSDVLGASMLVDAINNRKPSGATETTVLGPFHLSNAPRYKNGENICLDKKGEPLLIEGVVRDLEGKPIAGANLDIWQANDDGFYDVQKTDVIPDYNLRGIFTTDSEGKYWLQSVLPQYYAIPHDGPVGKMLKALGRHPNRPAHIHYIVGAKGYKTITTHIFKAGDPWLNSDAVFGVKKSLIVDFQKVDSEEKAKQFGIANPFWSVTNNFTLVKP